MSAIQRLIRFALDEEGGMIVEAKVTTRAGREGPRVLALLFADSAFRLDISRPRPSVDTGDAEIKAPPVLRTFSCQSFSLLRSSAARPSGLSASEGLIGFAVGKEGRGREHQDRGHHESRA